MFDRLRTETLNWILIISLILFVVELLFFKSGLIITAIVMVGLGYYGKKYYSSSVGKLLFWVAAISMIVIILNMTVVRFLLLVFLILFVLDYYKTKGIVYLQPQHGERDVTIEDKPILKKTPLFRQLLYGDQQTDDTAYAWRDINIFGGFGERKIDLSNAILEDDTVVISIRHGVGNITIYIPFDIEFSIIHSAIFGRDYILQEQQDELFNQQLNYQTIYYAKRKTRVKIVTSLISGNIEVKRISSYY